MVLGGVLLVGLVVGLFPRLLFGNDQSLAQELVQQTCAGCIAWKGAPSSRLEKKALDLIGAGSNFKQFHDNIVSGEETIGVE